MSLPRILLGTLVCFLLASTAHAQVCERTRSEEQSNLHAVMEAIATAAHDAANAVILDIGRPQGVLSAAQHSRNPIDSLNFFRRVANEAYLTSISSGYGSGKSSDPLQPQNKLMRMQQGTFSQPIFE